MTSLESGGKSEWNAAFLVGFECGGRSSLGNGICFASIRWSSSHHGRRSRGDNGIVAGLFAMAVAEDKRAGESSVDGEVVAGCAANAFGSFPRDEAWLPRL